MATITANVKVFESIKVTEDGFNVIQLEVGKVYNLRRPALNALANKQRWANRLLYMNLDDRGCTQLPLSMLMSIQSIQV
jgi:hypothetical protein